MTEVERNKAVMLRFYEEFWTAGNAAAADELIHEELMHDGFPAGWPTGREGFKRLVRVWREGFPDMRERVEFLIAEGDRVAGHFVLTGTHRGLFYGLPGTGRRVEVKGVDLVRVIGGQIVEWSYAEDALGLFRQLGALPPDLRVVAGSADQSSGELR